MASFLLPLGAQLLSNLLLPRGGAKHMSRRPRRRVYGSGKITDLLKKGRDFLKKHQLVSKVAKTAGSLGFKPELMGKIGSAASSLGYGRRRVKGKGIRLSGAARRTRGRGRVYM